MARLYNAEKRRAYYVRDRELYRAYRRDYYLKYKEQFARNYQDRREALLLDPVALEKERLRQREAMSRWKAKNPVKRYQMSRQVRWKAYGIKTPDGDALTYVYYDRLYQIQQGRCGICKRHQTEFKQMFHADHDHKTGIIRGLLCFDCNRRLDAIEDAEFLTSAKKYLLNKVEA